MAAVPARQTARAPPPALRAPGTCAVCSKPPNLCPVNWGLLGKGNASDAAPLEEQLEAGASGLKLREDWGTTPAAIDRCREVADRYDVPVAIHTDTLNEAGFVEDTIAAIAGRAIHTYHTEGAGGGHAPDIIRVAAELNVLPSSTNPTRSYTVNTLAEHMDMLMVCHHLSPRVPEDVAFAESRIRPETMAAEDVLHDTGVISMYASDSQAMGRLGENFTRLFQTADKMRQFKGKLPEDSPDHDNFRVLRYLAKLTINPAVTHGISHLVGSLEPGKLTDIVLWPVGSFGAKPKMIVKGGMVSWAVMGDSNGSIPTAEPQFYRPMFGAMGSAVARTSLTFMSGRAYELGIPQQPGLNRRVEPVRGYRTITKQDMVRNDVMPVIEADPDTYEVRVNGELATVPPAERLSLAQLYFLV